jgi:hypothetical protein
LPSIKGQLDIQPGGVVILHVDELLQNIPHA